jgi:hypothetical protein
MSDLDQILNKLKQDVSDYIKAEVEKKSKSEPVVSIQEVEEPKEPVEPEELSEPKLEQSKPAEEKSTNPLAELEKLLAKAKAKTPPPADDMSSNFKPIPQDNLAEDKVNNPDLSTSNDVSSFFQDPMQDPVKQPENPVVMEKPAAKYNPNDRSLNSARSLLSQVS